MSFSMNWKAAAKAFWHRWQSAQALMGFQSAACVQLSDYYNSALQQWQLEKAERERMHRELAQLKETSEAETIAKVVAWLTTKTVAYGEQPCLDRIIDELESGDWKR